MNDEFVAGFIDLAYYQFIYRVHILFIACRCASSWRWFCKL